MSDSGRILLHWPRFGPYHKARLRAAIAHFENRGLLLSGLEIASSDTVYAWRETNSSKTQIHTLFPGQTYEAISVVALWRKLNAYLKRIRPMAVAINGYSSKSALMLLIWCKWHACKAILMSDSKQDDHIRSAWRETLKGLLVRQYRAYLCAGRLHKDYLQSRGAKPRRIFLGYDVVDNAFFYHGAQQARQRPEEYAHLPGLERQSPFFLASSRFIPRKNLLGLLTAYHLYYRQMRSRGAKPWRLILLGDGEQRGELEDWILQRGLREWVTLPGFRQIEDLPAYYGLAQIFIHPALQDQWGLVVNEAMAAGLPVLVSEVCGCAPELVQEGVNGFTFPPQDSGQLAALMEAFSTGKYNLQSMRADSLQIIRNWGPARFAAGLYQAVEAATIT